VCSGEAAQIKLNERFQFALCCRSVCQKSGNDSDTCFINFSSECAQNGKLYKKLSPKILNQIDERSACPFPTGIDGQPLTDRC
jgi:hypothetical protein